jgi:hypothetical protein
MCKEATLNTLISVHIWEDFGYDDGLWVFTKLLIFKQEYQGGGIYASSPN